MSDIDAAFSEAMAELNVEAEVGPADGGQVDVGGEAPASDSFNFDDYADRTVTVKVAGEESTVPLKELRDGYMRQADYTRKTQEVAYARQIQQALEANPAETLKLLATAYDVQLTPAQQAIVDAADEPYVDPLEKQIQERFSQVDTRLSQVDAFLQQQQVAAARAEIETQVASMRQTYGDLFDEEAVLRTAYEKGGLPLDEAFKLVVADKLLAQQLAAQDFTAAQAAGDAERLAAKQTLAGVVSGGSSAAAASAAPPRIDSLEDAFKAAAAEHGWRLD